jgi:hypothetical protein
VEQGFGLETALFQPNRLSEPRFSIFGVRNGEIGVSRETGFVTRPGIRDFKFAIFSVSRETKISGFSGQGNYRRLDN